MGQKRFQTRNVPRREKPARGKNVTTRKQTGLAPRGPNGILTAALGPSKVAFGSEGRMWGFKKHRPGGGGGTAADLFGFFQARGGGVCSSDRGT